MVDIGAGQRVAADVFLPPAGLARPIAFCCLSGGGISRRYWDLRPETYSFAVWASRAGFPVLCVDHIGTGDSPLSDGATAPLLGQVVAANDAAFRILLDDLPGLRSVGVGHSMGATMTIRQQAAHDTYDAVALLGFGTEGLPTQLSPEILAACAERMPDDNRLAEWTLKMFGSAYPMLSEDSAKPMDAATTVLLGSGGLLSMLPGNVADSAARLRVPVLVLNGARDSLVNGHCARAEQYPQAASFTTYVFPGVGHNHNVAPARRQMWEKLLHWAESVVPS